MRQQRISISALASRIGKSSRLISHRLFQRNISIKKLNGILPSLDYKLAACGQDRFHRTIQGAEQRRQQERIHYEQHNA